MNMRCRGCGEYRENCGCENPVTTNYSNVSWAVLHGTRMMFRSKSDSDNYIISNVVALEITGEVQIGIHPNLQETDIRPTTGSLTIKVQKRNNKASVEISSE